MSCPTSNPLSQTQRRFITSLQESLGQSLFPLGYARLGHAQNPLPPEAAARSVALLKVDLMIQHNRMWALKAQMHSSYIFISK